MGVYVRFVSLKRLKLVSSVLSHTLLVFVVVISVIPLLYMISISLKPNGAEFDFPIHWIPERFAWENYVKAFNLVPTMMYLKNTLTISLISLVGELLTASLVAYGFARLRFPGRDFLFILMISTMMLPFFVTMIPLFVLYSSLGWIDTFYPLTVPAFFGGGPFFIFLLRQFYLTLPKELEDSARIDGAGFFRTWWSVLLPLTGPALATVAILSLVAHWNDFTGPLIILNSNKKFHPCSWHSPFSRSIFHIFQPDYGLCNNDDIANAHHVFLLPEIFCEGHFIDRTGWKII